MLYASLGYIPRNPALRSFCSCKNNVYPKTGYKHQDCIGPKAYGDRFPTPIQGISSPKANQPKTRQASQRSRQVRLIYTRSKPTKPLNWLATLTRQALPKNTSFESSYATQPYVE